MKIHLLMLALTLSTVCLIIAEPDRSGSLLGHTPGSYSSNIDKNLCVTVFGVVSLGFVVYLFTKRSMKVSENQTTLTKNIHDFQVSS